MLRGLETHLETIGYMHPAEMVFLNVNNPAVPSPTDCFLAPILYYTELALSNVKKWDMVRDRGLIVCRTISTLVN